MNLGKAIKLCRTQKNMSQTELARRAEISIAYLSMLERGKRDPNFSKVRDIAAALDVPVSILIFLATDHKELNAISPELVDRLSSTALNLISAS